MSSYNSSYNTGTSAEFIVAVVLGIAGFIAFCIGAIVIFVCFVKRCNKQRTSIANGIMLNPYPNNNPYYPPGYPPAYPPPGYSTPQPPGYSTPQPPAYSSFLVSQAKTPVISTPRPTTVPKLTDISTN